MPNMGELAKVGKDPLRDYIRKSQEALLNVLERERSGLSIKDISRRLIEFQKEINREDENFFLTWTSKYGPEGGEYTIEEELERYKEMGIVNFVENKWVLNLKGRKIITEKLNQKARDREKYGKKEFKKFDKEV